MEFKRVFGFPDFYGRTMDGWIDCMSSLADPEDGMTNIHCEKGNLLTLELHEARDLKERCPEIFEAITECAAFVNWRLIEAGEQPVLALSYNV